MHVHILIYSHRHGDDVYAFREMKDAERKITSIAREWWPVDIPETEIPTSDGELVERYFETMAEESYRIETVQVQ